MMRFLTSAVISCVLVFPGFAQKQSIPAHATRCDIELPIHVELVALNKPQVGQAARFEVVAESGIDPDLVRNIWVDYEVPEKIRSASPRLLRTRQPVSTRGRSRNELDLVVPDESLYRVQARLVVQLVDGKTVSRTATRWIDLGKEDPPDGMIGRIVDPDGTGVRVYQGTTR